MIKLRAQLLMYPDTTQEQIDAIDEQLLRLGVETITAAEVAHKLGATAHPMFDVESTADTTWTSERFIVIVRGQQYEAQVITGMWENGNSPLNNHTPGCYVNRYYSGMPLGAVNALQVIAGEIATEELVEELPVVGTALTIGKTLYEVVQAYREGVTPLTILEDNSYTFNILMGTTVRIVFVKGVGSPDSMQTLCYVGNHVNYNIQINIPIFTVINGQQIMEMKNDNNYDYSTSSYFDTNLCKSFAADNYRRIREGATDVDKLYQITRIPMELLDAKYVAVVPMDLPY